jgi:uncharacterized protein
MPDPSETYAIMGMEDVALCRAAAKCCIEISQHEPGDGLGNFRYCAAFNCKPGIPYYPASYAAAPSSYGSSCSPSVAIGLENGDLLFLAFHGLGDDLRQAKNNLSSALRQALLPVQAIVEAHCNKLGLVFEGIDASLAPGLEPPDSVGGPMQDVYPYSFGAMGSIAAVSTITAAIKSLASPSYEEEGVANGDAIRLVGYSGLMLPVMEDLIMAQRGIETMVDGSPALTVRNLLQLSAVCGVGVDTVPVPGSVSVEALASLYMDVGGLAYRLSKPLSCRVLPLPGLSAGEITTVDSPYLCNTKVFSL